MEGRDPEGSSEFQEKARRRPISSGDCLEFLENVSGLFAGSAQARPIRAVVARVCEVVSDKRLAKRCTVLLDITSTGLAPRRVFEARGLYPDPIDLTNTGAEEYTEGMHRVPLRDVIGVAQVVLQTARLKVASALELAETLVSDLQAFDPKPIARNPDLRGGQNADLVLALAIALWWGDKLTWNDDVGCRRYEPKGPECSWMAY